MLISNKNCFILKKKKNKKIRKKRKETIFIGCWKWPWKLKKHGKLKKKFLGDIKNNKYKDKRKENFLYKRKFIYIIY